MNNKLKEMINWALSPNFLLSENTIETTDIKKLSKISKTKENEWGSNIIGNKKWLINLSEELVFEILKIKGENPKKIINNKKNKYKFNFETDKFLYKVKTEKWNSKKNVKEKSLGTIYKYSEVKDIYKKPLKIICIAHLEWELTYGYIKLFGDISENKKKILDLGKELGIEYVKFSDLLEDINYK